MYRTSSIYEEIAKVIVGIFIDYNLNHFPIDEKDVCRKMGVAIVPYSTYGASAQALLIKRSKYGFFVKKTLNNAPTIYFNDNFNSLEAQRFTIFHELKHYVFEDDTDDDDDLADFFARYFMCPIPYLLLKKIDTPNEIVSFCGVSLEAAKNAWSNLNNRKKKYSYQLFDYEIPLIKNIEPVLLEVRTNRKDGDAYMCDENTH